MRMSLLRSDKTVIYSANVDNFKQLVEEAILAGQSLCHSDLRRQDLAGIDFRGANLTCSLMVETNLRGADMRRVDMSKVDCRSADLRGAKVAGVNWEKVIASGAKIDQVRAGKDFWSCLKGGDADMEKSLVKLSKFQETAQNTQDAQEDEGLSRRM